MTPFQGLLCLIVSFFAPSLLYLILGIILARTTRFHRIGIRCLAMCMFVSSRYISSACHQSCSSTKCGNWTCENYHHAQKDS